MTRPFRAVGLILGSTVLLAGCNSEPAPVAAPTTDAAAAVATSATVIPASLAPFGDGYPAMGNPCRQLGESAATSKWLDDNATLVGCPTAEDAAALRGTFIATVDGVTIISVPMAAGGAGAAMGPLAGEGAPMAPAAAPNRPPVAAKPQGDRIRGRGGLEEKCLKAVAAQGVDVIGTNRIDESQAAVDVYVNVEGGQAPWRCRGTRSGAVQDVEYTGSEGEL